MKLFELFEEKSTQQEITFDEFKKIIERDCASYIKQVGFKMPLYRGMEKVSNPAFIIETPDEDVPVYKKRVRLDRVPSAFSVEMHSMIDNWFNEKFQIKARSQTVFATGDKMDALLYGEAFIIFPIGEFKYVWSPNVADLFSKGLSSNPHELSMQLQKYQYRDTDLEEAIKSDCEIMIKCDSYYAISSYDYWNLDGKKNAS